MKKASPKVSVILPVFKGMDCLANALDALAGQSLSPDDFEVIVVDNGENQGIEGMMASFPRFSLVHEPQPGSYLARNTGVQHAHADILAFTDADCVPGRGWLEKGLDVLNARAELDLLGGKVELTFLHGRARTLAERYERLTAFPQQSYVADLHFAVTANLFVRRHVFEALDGFDGNLMSGGDRDFGERAWSSGYRLAYEPQVVVRHPARRSLIALLTKASRVTTSEMERWCKGTLHYDRRAQVNMIIPPLFWSWRLLRGQSAGSGLADRLATILVQNLIHLRVLPIRLQAMMSRRLNPATVRPASSQDSQ